MNTGESEHSSSRILRAQTKLSWNLKLYFCIFVYREKGLSEAYYQLGQHTQGR